MSLEQTYEQSTLRGKDKKVVIYSRAWVQGELRTDMAV